MRGSDRFWLTLGVTAAVIFMLRCLTPEVFTDTENLKKLIDLQPMIELMIILLCLWTVVPKLFTKIKGTTAYDLIYYVLFFIGCGIVIVLLPNYIPADATKDDQELYIQQIVYGLLGLFMITYAIWEGHKRKTAKKNMDAIKAESEEIHAEAIRKLEGRYNDQGNENN